VDDHGADGATAEPELSALAAFGWGAVGASALVLGAAGAMVTPVPRRVLGLVMGFGAGVLISAVAFDLVEEAADASGGAAGIGAGLLTGAVVFFLGDALIDRMGGDKRKASDGAQAGGSGLAIVLGAVLDGIPESMVLGLGLLEGEGISIAFIAAVFLSNLPEGLAASTGLLTSGWSRGRILGLWAAVVLVSALAALVGYVAFDGAAPGLIAFVLSFAGGAILCMLADTMMPEAFADEGRLVGLVTAAGFALAFALHSVQG
jgi:ZIP family zinc transporter